MSTTLTPPTPIPVGPTPGIQLSPDTPIPHPFIPGLQISARDLTPQSMGLTSGQMNAMPAHLMPGTCVTLCSIVPWTLRSQRYPHKGLPHYTIPAALQPDLASSAPVKPFQLLRLQNTSTMILLTSQSQDGHKFGPAPIFALGTSENPYDLNQGYAQDLVREWAGDHAAGITNARLGVGIIVGKRPWQLDNEPTTDEVAMLHRLQRNLYHGLIGAADRAFVSGDEQLKKRTMSQEYRRALEFAVRDYDEKFERHPWYIPLGSGGVANSMAACPACGGAFNRNAFICATCKTNLAEYHFERDLKADPTVFPGVAKEIEFMQKQFKAK